MIDISAIQFVDIIEFIGTFAFAISGIRLASAKIRFVWRFRCRASHRRWRWNIAHLSFLELIFSGCTIHFIYGVHFCITVRHHFHNHLIHLDNTFAFDTIGLALFVVVGAEKSLALGFSPWIAVAMGTITGSIGGVIRDVLINEIPLIFRKEIYALACVIGGIVFVSLHATNMVNMVVIEVITAAVVILVRYFAVKYHLSLPILKGERRKKIHD